MTDTRIKIKHFKDIRMKRVNSYIKLINEALNEHIYEAATRNGAAGNLMRYLNEHDYINHEGDIINKTNIINFIERVKSGNSNNESENKNDNLNFLPDNKLDQPMTQQAQPVNPLENLVSRQINVRNLLDIYNRYAPNPLTMEYVQQQSGGNQDVAKTYLLNQILIHARDGTLVTRGNFGKPADRPGMQDLAKIVLDLQRDVKRVKNAISPQGAEAIVTSHNANSRPSAHWKLNKRDVNAPASLTNLTDINNDGIPDVIISNAEGKPLFVNGYTTTATTYPVDLAYYNRYPTRRERRGNSYDAFKNELFNVRYDLDNADFSKRGDVSSFTVNNDYIPGYDMTKYHAPQPKRMSSFARFKKFVVALYLDQVLQNKHVPRSAKLAQSSKCASALWNQFILQPIYAKYNAQTEQDKARIKKKAAAEIDNKVNELYLCLTQTGANWTEDQRAALVNQFGTAMMNSIDDFEGNEFVQ